MWREKYEGRKGRGLQTMFSPPSAIYFAAIFFIYGFFIINVKDCTKDLSVILSAVAE
jgi:hypothetical protein